MFSASKKAPADGMGTALLEHVLTLKMQQEQGEMSKGTIGHLPSLELTVSPLKMGRAPIPLAMYTGMSLGN